MATKFVYDPVLGKNMKTVAEIMSLANKVPYPTQDATHLASFLGSCFKVIELEQRQKLLVKLEAKKKKQWEEAEARKREEEEAALKSLDMELPSAPMPGSLEMPGPGLGEIPTLDQFTSGSTSSAASSNAPNVGSAPQASATGGIPTLQEFESGMTNIPKPGALVQTSGSGTGDSITRKEYVIRIYDSPVGILIDKNDNDKYVYNVVEPHLDISAIDLAKKQYGSEFEKNNGLFDDDKFMRKVSQKVSSKTGIPITDLFVRKLKYYLERDIIGAGPFDALLFDEKVRTINCPGINKPITIESKPYGTISSNVIIKNNDHINHLMERVSKATMKPLNQNNPILDAKFQGFKFEGVMGIGGHSSKLTIRRLDNDI